MKPKSVLLIDDCNEMLVLQRMILEKEGFNVLTAQNGAAAFAVLSHIDDPALILLDLHMDDMSGQEFLEELAMLQPWTLDRVPVVFLSGSEPPQQSKATGYIQKFPDIEVFVEQVHYFIKQGIVPA